MNLDNALHQLARDLQVDADELVNYAAEDTETGWDYGAGDWPIGSIFGSEGKMLYAVIRALKPEVVVEFGTLYGCSAKHILKALVTNKHGKLVSVDPAPQIIEDRFTSTEERRWKRITAGYDTPKLSVDQADIVLEDADHSSELTETLVKRGLDLGAQLILSHDGDHFLVGRDIRAGFHRAVGDFKVVRTDDSDCGFAYTVRQAP